MTETMTTEIGIEICDLIGSEYGVLEEDAQRVCDALVTALQEGRKVVLSFAGIVILTTPFVRALIGDLYERFSPAQLQASLRLENISPDNATVFKFVADDIKLRRQNPQAYDAARAYALESAS